MENAVDALLMAGSVLLLIIALTVSVSSFTTLKTEVTEIIEERQETDLATVTDASGKVSYVNYIESADDIRTVDSDTVISTIRRIRRESYSVYICGDTVKNTTNTTITKTITKLTQSQIYKGKSGDVTIASQNDKVIYLSLNNSGYKYITEDYIEKLRNLIKNKQFKEYIGIYQEETAEGVSSANKQTYRVITFVET